MKKIISLLIIGLMLTIVSCETTVEKRRLNETYRGIEIEVMIIDSCEYLFVSSDFGTLTHKGNCKFCEYRRIKKLN